MRYYSGGVFDSDAISACAFSQVQRQAEETKSGKGPALPAPAAGGAADASAPNASSAGAGGGTNSAALGEAQTIDALLRLIHFIPKVRTDRILNPKRICRKHQVLEFSRPVKADCVYFANICFSTKMVATLLGDDVAFKSACKDAFTTVVNADVGKGDFMHMLANYTDNLLKVRMFVGSTVLIVGTR
jgi:hypothetical protein